MPLNRADVELLDRNLQDLTETGLKRQGLKQNQQRIDQEHDKEVAEELMRQKMLEVETRRGNTEADKAKIEAQGKTKAWIQNPQGSKSEIEGPQSAIDAILKRPGYKQVDADPKERQKQNFVHVQVAPNVFSRVYYDNDEADKVLSDAAAAAKQFKAPAKPTPGVTSAVQTDTAAADLEQKAAELEAQANQIDTSQAQTGDPDAVTSLAPLTSKKAGLMSQASDFKSRAKALRSVIGPKPPTTWETQTIKRGGLPGLPPTVTRSIRGPAGSVAPALSAPPPAGAAANVVTDHKGQKWLYKGSSPDPTKDKDPNNWEAQP